jgi:hypothetical protein
MDWVGSIIWSILPIGRLWGGGGGGGARMGGVSDRFTRAKEPFVVGWAGTAPSGSVVMISAFSMARISYVARLKSRRVAAK